MCRHCFCKSEVTLDSGDERLEDTGIGSQLRSRKLFEDLCQRELFVFIFELLLGEIPAQESCQVGRHRDAQCNVLRLLGDFFNSKFLVQKHVDDLFAFSAWQFQEKLCEYFESWIRTGFWLFPRAFLPEKFVRFEFQEDLLKRLPSDLRKQGDDRKFFEISFLALKARHRIALEIVGQVLVLAVVLLLVLHRVFQEPGAEGLHFSHWGVV